MRELWQRLVVWFGMRYDRWPKSWHDAKDASWTTVASSTPDTFTVGIAEILEIEFDRELNDDD